MSRKDAVLLASRVLAVLITVWALTDLSYLPERLHSYLHYTQLSDSSSYVLYMRHYYLIATGFLITRVVGFFLMAIWLRRCGSDVQELLLPPESDEG